MHHWTKEAFLEKCVKKDKIDGYERGELISSILEVVGELVEEAYNEGLIEGKLAKYTKKIRYSDRVTQIWCDYHEKLTGSRDVERDEHGNLFGSIAKFRPKFQSEILHIMYVEGFKDGKKAANQ